MNRPYQKMARYYDLFYRNVEEQTPTQLDFLKWAFTNLAQRKVNRVLDVGCGTGRLALPLANLGLSVTGIDASSEMLEMARLKAKDYGLEELRLEQGDMRSLPYREEFDALLCINSAFNYLLEDRDVKLTLESFYKALRQGGLLVLELANFFSILREFQPVVVLNGGDEHVDYHRSVAHTFEDVTQLWYHNEFDTVVENSQAHHWRELHTLRMFTHNELRHFLTDAGFTKVNCYSTYDERVAEPKNARRLIFTAVKE